MRNKTVITFSVLLLLLSSGCTSTQNRSVSKGSFISTNLPLTSYVKMGLNAKTGSRFFFPQLQIYNESGDLVYSGHESNNNVQLLQELPDSIKGLRPEPGSNNLAEVTQQVPDFRAGKQQFAGQGRITVLSIFLENCEACTAQEDALSDGQRRLLSRGINLLVIHLSRPATPPQPAARKST